MSQYCNNCGKHFSVCREINGCTDLEADWEYLLGEISAAKIVLNDGVLDRLNDKIRKIK